MENKDFKWRPESSGVVFSMTLILSSSGLNNGFNSMIEKDETANALFKSHE